MEEFVPRLFGSIAFPIALWWHRNSLPKNSSYTDPKMEYAILQDAVFWEDEGLERANPNIRNPFMHVIMHRTNLIVYPKNEIENTASDRFNKRIFNIAKKLFPDWIGFQEERCTYNPELSHRIKRIRKVSEWKLKKFLEEDDKLYDYTDQN
ncbi:hypothetical protein [uncultured Tenacibaculum sp.]|uniref:hypothetical protein n=1 Tax=uncultured Tenacibaculum sp. TaxID=174713 RepID=UPI002604CB5B|nr:hypothetical protein [uncultured Tenacibaculum sp.]